MYKFCTLFDVNYIHRGLALYRSLKKHCPQFHLWILCMDDKSLEALEKFKLDSVTLIKLEDFEDDDLRRVKKERTRGEYCWTCTSSLIVYVLKKFNLDICTYLDSDIFFYSDPGALLNEIGDNDAIITEHRYTQKYDQTETSGKYCVQFMTFKNNSNAFHILEWWRNQCIEWCYAKFENGKFGDQKYLDDWTTRFKGVHVLRNIGGGVAPWNIQQYEMVKDNGALYVIDKGEKCKLVFYHFHALKFLEINNVYLGAYDLPTSSMNLIYSIYIRALLAAEKELFQEGFNFSLQPAVSSMQKLMLYFRFLRKRHNVFLMHDLLE